jgi:hypothetical protein
VPANTVAANLEAGAKVASSLGSALATLHSLAPPPLLNKLKVNDDGFVEDYVHCTGAGFGDFQSLKHHPFVGWLLAREELCKSTLKSLSADLPSGLLHGDPFLDNMLVDEETLESVALLDWEDCCEGPLAYDLATAVVGGGFSKSGALQVDRVRALLEGYESGRRLGKEEKAGLVSWCLGSRVCGDDPPNPPFCWRGRTCCARPPPH